MSLNPYHTKPVHEFLFSCKINKTHHPLLMVNDVPVKRVPYS